MGVFSLRIGLGVIGGGRGLGHKGSRWFRLGWRELGHAETIASNTINHDALQSVSTVQRRAMATATALMVDVFAACLNG